MKITKRQLRNLIREQAGSYEGSVWVITGKVDRGNYDMDTDILGVFDDPSKANEAIKDEGPDLMLSRCHSIYSTYKDFYHEDHRNTVTKICQVYSC